MYLKTDDHTFRAPQFPEPPKHLVIKDSVIEHLPKRKTSDDLVRLVQIENDLRSAESGFASLYTEKQDVEGTNQKLLKKLRAFDRYKLRVRRIFNHLMNIDGSTAVTSKMLQKDLYIAERTVEKLQIENDGFLSTIQNFEEKENLLKKTEEENRQELEDLKFNFQILAEKFDEKNKMLELAEEQFQNHLLNVEKLTSSLNEFSKKEQSLREEIQILKRSHTESQMSEDNFAKLNSDLADALAKLQKKNKDLDLELRIKRREYDELLKLQNHETQFNQEMSEANHLIEKVKNFTPALEEHSIVEDASEVRDEDWKYSKDENSQLLAEAYPSIITKPLIETKKDSKNLKAFYDRWSHIIDELSTHSTPLAKTNTQNYSLDNLENVGCEDQNTKIGEFGI
jgi:chromosome segregation ATPase